MRPFERLEATVPEETPDPVRPARPAAIELAAAVLIVGGVLGVVGVLGSLGTAQPAGLEVVPLITLVLNLAEIAVGAFIRGGRLWLVAVNYVAVIGFLDLLAAGASPLAMMLGIAEVLVVVILMLNRPWFEALRAWRAEMRARALHAA
jgi:hypothetical protein